MMDTDLEDIFDEMESEEEDLTDIKSLIEEANILLNEGMVKQNSDTEVENKVTPISEQAGEIAMKKLVVWFISTLVVCIIGGVAFGAICVLAIMCYSQKKNAKRLADA